MILILPDAYFLHCALLILLLIVLGGLFCFWIYGKRKKGGGTEKTGKGQMTAGPAQDGCKDRAVQLCAYCTWLHGFCVFMAHSCAQDAAGIMKKDKFKEKIQKRLTEMRKKC